jgi:hypothetical protein
MRHAHVQMDWKRSYDSAEYDRENEAYDRADIEPLTPRDLSIYRVYISRLRRSAESAAFLLGPVRVEKSDLIDEVPLRSCFDTACRLPTWFWNAMATLQWYHGAERQIEKRFETDRKIDAFLDRIEAEGEDCIVVGHGLYFYEMMKRMKKRGYSGRAKRSMRNGETIAFTLDDPAMRTGGKDK